MIQRYDLTYDVATEDFDITPVPESHEGRFVAYEDYAALEAKCSEVKRRVELEPKHSEVKTYAVNCNDAWLNTEGDDTSGSYVKFSDYMALEAKYSEAQRELVALRSQVRDASALVKQLHKSLSDKVLLSRSCNNQTQEALKCDSPQSDEYIFDALSTCSADTLDITGQGAPKEEAWTVWHGGENPVPGKRVDVKYRDGVVAIDAFSDCVGWDRALLGYGSDIIAYRVVKEG